MGQEDKLPGITFFVEEAEFGAGTSRVVLTADVRDHELWTAVIDKLDGFKVYSIDDFQSALVQALKLELQQQRERYEEQVRSLQTTLQRLTQGRSVQQPDDLNSVLDGLLLGPSHTNHCGGHNAR